MTQLTVDHASAYAKKLYGLDAVAIALPGEYDHNFVLTDHEQQQFVLKIMHPSRQKAEIDLQCQILSHVAKQETQVALPRVHPALDGALITAVSIDGETHYIWLLDYLPNPLLAEAMPHLPHLLVDLGRKLGQLDGAMMGFAHPMAKREHKWDIQQAGWIAEYIQYIADADKQALVRRLFTEFSDNTLPQLAHLRQSVIYGDANDYNILVDSPDVLLRGVAGFIDFGDAVYTATVCNLAIACAYAMLGKNNPLETAGLVVKGYHEHFPLTETEISLLFSLICTRLCVSVTNSAYRSRTDSTPYIVISEQPAWDTLEQLANIHPNFAHYFFREACGLPPVPQAERITAWLKAQQHTFHPMTDYSLQTTPLTVLDLSVSSRMLAQLPEPLDTATLTHLIDNEMRKNKAKIGVGRYNEARRIYQSDDFFEDASPIAKSRTVHLGIDLFMLPAGEVIYAPLAGRVHYLGNNTARLDYGPHIILQHETTDGDIFYTLYAHLDEDCLTTLKIGQTIQRGDKIARIGSPPSNGDWTPHLHFQIIVDLLDLNQRFPGVAFAEQRDLWLALCPDPNLILNIPDEHFPQAEPTWEQSLADRQRYIGNNLSLSYAQPLKMVRGWMQYLYDDTGRAYLDLYNNVPHIGHSHPRVVQVAQDQMAVLTTNTRYLHDNITRYAQRLTALMPESLEVCYFLNSASEANELAIRLARAYTGQYDMIVLENAYHGHTNTLIDISPYKFNGTGGEGAKPWVQVAPVPDDYRGVYRRDDPERAQKYADHVAHCIEQVQAQGRGIAAFIAETLPSVGGQIIPPAGYLDAVYRHVRQAGGVCIADEVQVGLGRLGRYFWGFDMQAVIPDIVVLGKPIGNGHPLAAVVTRREIAEAFDNGMEFFSTFGGNPVSCAVGLTLLDVLAEENLPQNAERIGRYLLDGLKALMAEFTIIGDVRGVGLFLGVELVDNHETLQPARRQTHYIVNRLRDEGILSGIDGPLYNVIKLRPSLIFTQADIDLFLTIFKQILGEDGAQPSL